VLKCWCKVGGGWQGGVVLGRGDDVSRPELAARPPHVVCIAARTIK
jgi:hypothetical protein